MFKRICLMLIIISCFAGVLQLRQEIENTQQLIYLYQQKLRILKEVYEKNYPDMHHESKIIRRQRMTTPLTVKMNSQLALINKFDYPTIFFQDRYLLNNNQVIDATNREIIAQFMGEILIIENSAITTLIGGKINMVQFKQQSGRLKKQEYFLGLSAEKLDSIWHRNYNIKDGEDLLIQWQNNKIYFRGKEVNTITMPMEEKIISIYSLNQYKVIFVSTHRIGIINSRSLQIGQCEMAQNITKMKNSSTSDTMIIQSYKQDNFIIILLSTGEIAKYYNQKIVNIQLLSSLTHQLTSFQSTIRLQYIHPYLFISNQRKSSIKVFNNHINRFQQVISINVEQHNPRFAFFKQNDSYRAVITSQNETNIYEILLPIVEEPIGGTNYFKFVGIFVVILCFVYFKWIKKSDDDSEVIDRRQLTRKQQQLDRIRAQAQQRPEQMKEKNKYPQSEIEQFLKKEPRDHHKKAN